MLSTFATTNDPVLRHAYALAIEDREPQVLIVPTVATLPMVNPARVALRFPEHQQRAVNTAIKALLDIYQDPSYENISGAASALAAASIPLQPDPPRPWGLIPRERKHSDPILAGIEHHARQQAGEE